MCASVCLLDRVRRREGEETLKVRKEREIV